MCSGSLSFSTPLIPLLQMRLHFKLYIPGHQKPLSALCSPSGIPAAPAEDSTGLISSRSTHDFKLTCLTAPDPAGGGSLCSNRAPSPYCQWTPGRSQGSRCSSVNPGKQVLSSHLTDEKVEPREDKRPS